MYRTGAAVGGSAIVTTGVVAAAVTGTYVASIISAGGALAVAAIAAVTAERRQSRALAAESARQSTAILAENHRQAAEFSRARADADLADVRSVLEDMIRSLRLADEVCNDFRAGHAAQELVVRAARTALEESTISCRLRVGATDRVAMAYAELQTSFHAVVEHASADAQQEALLDYAIAREHFNDIATERFASALRATDDLRLNRQRLESSQAVGVGGNTHPTVDGRRGVVRRHAARRALVPGRSSGRR
jgi:hypothetical protein